MWTLVIGLCVFLAVRAVSKMLRNAQARRWVAEWEEADRQAAYLTQARELLARRLAAEREAAEREAEWEAGREARRKAWREAHPEIVRAAEEEMRRLENRYRYTRPGSD